VVLFLSAIAIVIGATGCLTWYPLCFVHAANDVFFVCELVDACSDGTAAIICIYFFQHRERSEFSSVPCYDRLLSVILF
jgi:hypothetical protein